MAAQGKHDSKPGYVRIIGGRWRRRRLPVPAGVDLRPTPDRVRETLFAWLGPRLAGARCLDLFAGTGALGFEALSRGASELVLVERERAAARSLGEACAALGARAEILCEDVGRVLARADLGAFDIVFVDPPYSLAVDAVFAHLPPLLRPEARIYLERARGDPWPKPAGFHWLRRGQAGAVAFGLAEPAAP